MTNPKEASAAGNGAASFVQTAAGPIPPPVDRQTLLQEISSNIWRFGFSQERLLNPDELVGRRGLRAYRQMLPDDQVKAALALKKHAILTTGWDIEPASKSAADVEVADFVRWTLEHVEGSFDDDLFQILTALQFGFSVTEAVYHPVAAGTHAGKLTLKTLKTRLPDQITFAVDAHDNLLDDGIEQFGRRLPTWKFVIYSHCNEFSNWYGTSDLRSAYRPWWHKDFALKAWGMFMDRYSVPLALGTYPGTDGNINDGVVQAFRSALSNLQVATSMTLPDGYKVEFPQVGAQGSQIFALAVSQADMSIARSILVPNLLGVSPGGQTGSFSQAKKQFDVFILVVEKLQQDVAQIVVNEQIIRRLVDLNYRVPEYPRFMFLPFTDTDKTQLLELFLKAITVGGVTPDPVDEIHIRSVTQFPEMSLQELQKKRAGAPTQESAPDGGTSMSRGSDGSPSDTPTGDKPVGGSPSAGAAGGQELTDGALEALIAQVLRDQLSPVRQNASTGRFSIL